jgi:signal transduction histidine kinase
VRTELQPSGPAAGSPLSPPLPDFSWPSDWLDSGMAILDTADGVEQVNESLSQWLELPRAQISGRNFWEIIEARAPQWRESLALARQNRDPFVRLNLKLSRNDPPEAQWFGLELARNSAGVFVRLNSILPPLSEMEEGAWDEHLRSSPERREMFVRMLRAEAHLDRLLRRWPCVVFSQRPDFSMTFASPNIESLTGVTAADWLRPAARFWELAHDLDAEEWRQQVTRAVQTRSSTAGTYRLRHALTGRVAYVLEHRQPVFSQNGLLLGYEVVWQDVTRQAVAEKRLSAAAWKETLAVLTLGMAHDFRNIMAGIHSLSESFLARADGQNPFREGLTLIRQNSLQASQLVQRMISLHLGQPGERAYHDLNEIARDLAGLVGKIVSRRIQVETELAAGQLPIHADLVELRQTIINLMLNAADAMPAGGRLVLRTSLHQQMPAVPHLLGVPPRLPCVCLAVVDTGCGIPERHLVSIFEPFFTTKTKGTGLGLYNARIAIENHRGAISVDSKEGAGTSFRLWLPQADFSEAEAGAVASPPDRVQRLCVLLLGRRGGMLDQTAEFLRSNNYEIVTAHSPEQLATLLQPAEHRVAGILLLAEPKDALAGEFLTEARRLRRYARIALKPAGCNPDELDGQLLKGADLLLSPDLPETDVLSRLQSFLR